MIPATVARTSRLWVLALVAVFLIGCSQSEPGAPLPALASIVPTSSATDVATGLAAEAVWQPGLNTSWQWQLNDLPIDRSVEAEMYDIDLFENDAATVAALHTKGRKVVCYVNAGGWEE